jgi:hypothetical protein
MNAPVFEAARLLGTWRLVRATAVAADGGELPAPYGPAPMGRLVLNADGRMMAVLCDGRPILPAGEKRAYASYCGNFRIEGTRLITTVDGAVRAERIGGEQVRHLEMNGDLLVLVPPQRPDGAQRKLYWALDGPP